MISLSKSVFLWFSQSAWATRTK